jgi:hypothetical protein
MPPANAFERMDMKVIQDDDDMTHVVLDGRFDIQGAHTVPASACRTTSVSTARDGLATSGRPELLG